ncbi:MAG: MlaD family protein [Bacteriovoracaceae bacterium]|nr:MlaD family protein [Bacteriovoracaceae bacterium]
MRAKDRSNLVRVGIFVTGLTIVLMIMIAAIGKESALFEKKVMVRAQVLNAENLKPGASVELRGLRIGHVEEIKIVGQELVEIGALITESDLKWIKKDGKVSINNAGLVGDKYLEIIGGSEEAERFNPLKDVLTSEPSLDFKAMAAKGGSIADKADRVLSKVEVLVEAIDGKKLAVTMDSLSKAAEHFSKASAPMAATAHKLESASTRLDQVMERVQKGPGTAHAMIYDDALYEDLRKLLGGAERNTVIKYFIRESIKKAPTK